MGRADWELVGRRGMTSGVRLERRRFPLVEPSLFPGFGHADAKAPGEGWSWRPTLSGGTEAFFASGRPGRLVVVCHIPKTAGTALRQVVRANLPAAEMDLTASLPAKALPRRALLAWYGGWYRSLGADRRDRLCCVISHSAGCLLPALDRPFEALVLVREPVDRVLSWYAMRQRLRRGSRVKRSLPSLEALYGSVPEAIYRPAHFFNWQSRVLLAPFHDVSRLGFSTGPPPDGEVWWTRLRQLVEDVYLVGVQDRFRQYVDELARRFDWQPFLPRAAKINRTRPPEVGRELRASILAANWLDARLHRHCRELQITRERATR